MFKRACQYSEQDNETSLNIGEKKAKLSSFEDMIVYQSSKGDTWVRPRFMWNEVIDEKGTLRFTLIQE